MRAKLKTVFFPSLIFFVLFFFFLYSKRSNEFAERKRRNDHVQQMEQLKKENNNNEDYFRCEAKHFGCYKKSIAINGRITIPAFLESFHLWNKYTIVQKDFKDLATHEHCIKYCSTRKLPFAGLSGSTCYCVHEPRKIMRTTRQIYSHPCTEQCTGNHNQTCGSSDAVDFFYIPNFCTKGKASEEHVDGSLLGCFQSPQPVEFESNEFVHYGMIPDQYLCFAICEKKSFVLAMWKRNGDCSCGRFTKNFNLANRIKEGSCLNSDHVMVYKTWAEDTRCSSMKFKSDDLEEKVVLTSVPSSGNTWLRYLIEKSTGFFTGSIYRDIQVFHKGYLGEMTKEALLVKNHMYDQKLSKYSAIVFIIRDPYETMISEFKRQTTKKHVGEVTNEQIKKDFVAHDKGTLKLLAGVLTSSGKPMHVIYYDELKQDPIGQLRKLVEFAPLQSLRTDDFEDRLLCVSEQLTGYFKRKSQPLDFDPFSEELKTEVNKNIADARDILKEFGYKLPNYERPVM